ncbi:hypothetical protein I302_108600 [Kwoniella bestiolae CBS 10118]|uniref:ATP-dependent DNA helicase PIF1 n=1 Tax=Kwoniella bestiolae CBS 10118 TaxID=1296100 RepID=A0A1B9FTK0_9TREE|nr:hypothetical protein I302_07738 [Kwoniella bestiolae CBS 10118]OCF22096.1 hypothetical protein I302_07738 [Kwoniella bestiolae CBS 10118]
MPKAKWYAVRVGRRPGVYANWSEAENQVRGYPGALHKSFPDPRAAEGWVRAGQRHNPVITTTSLYRQSSKQLITDEDLELDTSPAEIKQRNSPAVLLKQRMDSLLTTEIKPCPAVEDPPLSAQQEEILCRILNGENYFFTGSAGTGKSVLLRAIIKAFRQREADERNDKEDKWKRYLSGEDRNGQGNEVKRWKLGVTASTGMAGVNIGGSTVHSWAGIGLGELPAQKLYENILRNKITAKRWKSTGALIIDEVSMIDSKLFDKLEFIARKIRKTEKPFGGIQLILSGDFFQLPPVTKGHINNCSFAFEALSWSKVIPRENMTSLTRVFRQKENRFVDILESMRKGFIKPQDVEVLRGLARDVKYPEGIEPIGLYPQKAEVAAINSARLEALETPLQIFSSFDVPGTNSHGWALDSRQATECLNRNTIWPQDLELKVGALVMLVTNMQDGVLVNGSTGTVVDFMTLSEASAVNIHPAAGNYGSAPDPKVAWPVVEFIPSKHASGKVAKRVVVPQMSVDVLNAAGRAEATRHQIPLILAWALTIHKSQGQTLERVKIDLNNIFVEGQTYVAISRAVSLDTLQLLNFSAHKVMAHSRVIEWAKPFEQEQKDEEEWDELLAGANFDF